MHDTSLTETEQLTSGFRFHPVTLPRAHEQVVDQITYAIRSGVLRPGDRLPTIEELADLTAVSKPVIGDAVKLLREAGVLESKRGVQGGVSVISDDVPAEILRLIVEWREATLTELVEARRPIEAELALLAGERGTQADFDQMRASLAKVRQAHGDGEKGSFLRYDHLFHYQIGLAARSEKLAYYQHRILSEIAAILDEYELFHEDLDLVLTTHEKMLVALEARDPDLIREAVDSHWRTSSGAFAGVDELTIRSDGHDAD